MQRQIKAAINAIHRRYPGTKAVEGENQYGTLAVDVPCAAGRAVVIGTQHYTTTIRWRAMVGDTTLFDGHNLALLFQALDSGQPTVALPAARHWFVASDSEDTDSEQG